MIPNACKVTTTLGTKKIGSCLKRVVIQGYLLLSIMKNLGIKVSLLIGGRCSEVIVSTGLTVFSRMVAQSERLRIRDYNFQQKLTLHITSYIYCTWNTLIICGQKEGRCSPSKNGSLKVRTSAPCIAAFGAKHNGMQHLFPHPFSLSF